MDRDCGKADATFEQSASGGAGGVQLRHGGHEELWNHQRGRVSGATDGTEGEHVATTFAGMVLRQRRQTRGKATSD